MSSGCTCTYEPSELPRVLFVLGPDHGRTMLEGPRRRGVPAQICCIESACVFVCGWRIECEWSGRPWQRDGTDERPRKDRSFETPSLMSHGLEQGRTRNLHCCMHAQTYRFHCALFQCVWCAFPLANTRPIFNRKQRRIFGDDLSTPASSLPPHPTLTLPPLTS